LQVAAVPLLAWALLGERPGRRFLAVLPVVLAGIVLISGALENGAYGRDPAAGAIFGILTGLAYAGFILVLRQSSAARRPPAGRPALRRRRRGRGDDAGRRAGDRRPRPRPDVARPRLARHAGADLADPRLAADLGIAAAAARGDRLDAAHDPAHRLGRPRG